MNILCGLFIILFGAISIPIDNDATFFVFMLIIGMAMVATKKSIFYSMKEDEYLWGELNEED